MNKEYILVHQEKKLLRYFYKYKYYFLLIPSAAATFLLLIINIDFDLNFESRDIHLTWNTLDDYKYMDVFEKEYFIKTRGCTIPAFEPFDQSVIQFFHNEEPVHCYNESSPPLVDSDHTSLWIVEKHFSNYSINNRDDLACCYMPFYRQSYSEDSKDERFKYLNESIAFTNRTFIKHEFIKVECQYKQQLIYKDFHSFVIKSKIRYKINSSNKYNVLILGIDAVSRLNFHRTMPLTLKYLQDSDAIEFKGYNKVGDNTFPNLIPVLTGLSENELSNTCYPEKNSTFDDCLFIWKKYSEAGYYTAFGEDAAPISLFNYLKRGFIKKPTDYYWRTFAFLADKDIGHEKQLNANLCLGPRLSVEVLLSYVQKFVRTMLHNPYFGFFWETSITHDFLNYPLLCDNKYETLIKAMQSEGLLDRTILVLLSDHGIRWGDIRGTHQGRMEERLPFLFFVFPKKFRQKYPHAIYNMKMNTKRLTTPFDLHSTMLDLLDTEGLSNEKIHKKATRKEYLNSRGISLFLPIHENRTCQTAGIEPHWCTCHQTRKLETNNTLAFRVANIAVEHINYLLTNNARCAKLNISKIIDFTIGEPYSALTSDAKHVVLDYTITLETHPGWGLFEATVRKTWGGLNVTGAVSRINLYGQQSWCVDDFHLKLYCYCDNDLSTR